MDEKTKKEIKSAAIHYWYVLACFILFVLLIFFYQRNESNKKQLETLKSQINLNQEIQKTESNLEEMKQREKELYPILQQKYSELNNIDLLISKKRNELKEIERKKINEKIQKMDINSLSTQLLQLGYPNTIISE